MTRRKRTCTRREEKEKVDENTVGTRVVGNARRVFRGGDECTSRASRRVGEVVAARLRAARVYCRRLVRFIPAKSDVISARDPVPVRARARAPSPQPPPPTSCRAVRV